MPAHKPIALGAHFQVHDECMKIKLYYNHHALSGVQCCNSFAETALEFEWQGKSSMNSNHFYFMSLDY